MNLRVCVVTGGSDQMYEGHNLSKRPHIVVAMPGRLADHILGCDTFSLKKIKYLVIDEADRYIFIAILCKFMFLCLFPLFLLYRLLSGSFDDDLEKVFNVLPAKKQTLLFSATINEHIRENQFFTLNPEVCDLIVSNVTYN